ncbi:hypothetical protein SLEP1_g7742 [Rubroshorea leprosula]|uniref:MADS-box domain-containing protein n=1 Tax=Rubroshorea leprosula TaxID=152421 RepID=A0AAV5I7R1_9ROSI|nr:hypothetical protein SLEP1_g7742 [Rubroshorea leprosula]
MASAGKKTKGKQKIEIRKIENEEDRLITFSKRRSGIIKKSSELVTLCGTEICFVVFSPSGKAFSFGHPSVDLVLNRFLAPQNQPHDDNSNLFVEANRKMKIDELNKQYNDLVIHLEEVIEKGQVLDQRNFGLKGRGWWERPTEQLNLEELRQMVGKLNELRNHSISKLREKLAASAAAAADAPHPLMMMPTPGLAPAMMNPSYQMMNDPYYGTNIGDDMILGAGTSSFVPGSSYGVPNPTLMNPTHHQMLSNPYETTIGRAVQGAGPSTFVPGPSYGIPPAPGMMNPALQMMNNPYGANIGNQGAGPSSSAPRPSYGIPPPESSE